MKSFQTSFRILLAASVLGLLMQAKVRAAETRADLVQWDFAEERVVDLSVVKKVTGKTKLLGFIAMPHYTEYLEGFIRGMVVDYNDNPVEGVLVRVGDPGEENSMFDPTVTNFNGIYRIRFSIPFDKKDKVDIRNKLVYAPDWEQKRDSLGNSYEPLDRETPFHLYYDRSKKLLAFAEGLRKSFVNPVNRGEPALEKGGGKTKKAAEGSKKEEKGGGDDFFKAFGGGF
jgi:hypothetical protein